MDSKVLLNTFFAKILGELCAHVLAAPIRVQLTYTRLRILSGEVCNMLLECLQRVTFLLQKPYLGFTTIVVHEADIVDATTYADGLCWSPEIHMDDFSICTHAQASWEDS